MAPLATNGSQPLGSIHSASGIQPRIHRSTPKSFSVPSGENLLVKEGDNDAFRRTYYRITSNTSSRASSASKFTGLLQSNFSSSKESRKTQTGNRSKHVKSLSKAQAIQDGDIRISQTITIPEYVDVQSRPVKRLLSYSHSSSKSQVLKDRISGKDLSVPSSSLRVEDSSLAIHNGIQRSQGSSFKTRRSYSSLSRRLARKSSVSSNMCSKSCQTGSPLQRIRNSHKSREVRFYSPSKVRFCRDTLRPDTISGFSYSGQPGQSGIQHDDDSVIESSPGSGLAIDHRGCVVPGQTNPLRSIACQTISNTPSRPLGSLFRRPYGIDSHSTSHTGSCLVASPKESYERCTPRSPSIHTPDIHGCLYQGLGGSYGRTCCSRPMVSRRKCSSYKCVGNESSCTCYSGLSHYPGGCCHDFIRQHHSCGLYKSPRGDQVQIPMARNSTIVSVSHEKGSIPESSSYSRTSQRDCRPAFQTGSNSTNRVVSSPRGSASSFPRVGHAPGRSVCNQIQSQVPVIRLPSPRFSGNGDRRSVNQLGGTVGLRLPSSSNIVQSSGQNETTQLSVDNHSAPVAQTSVVPRSIGVVDTASIQASSTAQTVEATQNVSVPPNARIPQSARLAAEKHALQQRGFSQATLERIVAPQRVSTLAVYEGKWRLFSTWCDQRKSDPVQASVPLIADFLLHLFRDKGLAPATIDGYRSAIAGALKHRLDLGKSKELSALIASFYQDKPRIRRSIPSWNLSLVLACLARPPFEPLQSCDLKWLTMKTVFLTLLASGSRRGEIHAIEYASLKHDEQWRYVILKPHDAFVSKTQLRTSGASALESIKIPALGATLTQGLESERFLCPVRAIKVYQSRTLNLREGKRLLFIAYKKGHQGDICKNTVSGWVKSLLVKVHEEVTDGILSLHNTRAHEVRALASSLAFRGNMDLEDVMQSCSWRSKSTFSSFYLRDVSSIQGDLHVLGPIVAAQSVVRPSDNRV